MKYWSVVLAFGLFILLLGALIESIDVVTIGIVLEIVSLGVIEILDRLEAVEARLKKRRNR